MAYGLLVGAPVAGEDVLAVDELREEVLRARGLELALVVKPVRGRGSEAVTVVRTLQELRACVTDVLSATVTVNGRRLPRYGERVVVEEYLPGEELTLTIMPPGDYWIKRKRGRAPVALGVAAGPGGSIMSTASRRTAASWRS